MNTGQRKLRIAQVVSTFPPYMGGIGNVCYNISLELQRRNHVVTVLTPKYNRHQRDRYPFTVKRIEPLFTIGNAGLVPRLMSALRDFDVIHLHYPFFGGDLFVLLASKIRHIPYVITYHQDATAAGTLNKALMGIYRALFENLIIKQAAIIFGLSEDHLEHSRIRYICQDEKRYIVTGNGVNPPSNRELVSVKNNIRKLFDTSADPFIIGFIGNLDRAHFFKNVPFIIKAMKELPDSIKLVIVGDGDLKNEYEQLTEQLHLTERVKFLGNIDNAEIFSIISQFGCLALPSSQVESFGVVLIEAMACGIPVVASNIPGVRALVQDGVTGFLFPPDSLEMYIAAITKLQQHPLLCQQLGQKGRELVAGHFTWKQVVDKIEAGYYQAIGSWILSKS